MATALVWKECRALAPVFAAALLMLLATALVRHPDVAWLGIGVYILGAIALGALCVGHEFAHDTLGQLLAQPGRRLRLLAIKLSVLASLLAALWLAGTFVLGHHIDNSPMLATGGTRWFLRWMLLVLPPLVAFSVAPWLTMLCRSALAGIVFTLAGYAALWVVLRQSGVVFVSYAALIVAPGDITLPLLLVAACAAAVLANARTFTRLEAAGSSVGTAVTVDVFSHAHAAGAPPAIRQPWRVLVMKELRLQGTSFIVAGLYAAGWAAMPLTGGTFESQYVFGGITALYQLLLAALIGALASAEERHFGTLLWQTLQPYPIVRQWGIKVTVVVLLTLTLAAVLPNALHAISPHAGELSFRLSIDRGLTGMISIGRAAPLLVAMVMLALVGLFVSSFSRSSIHALMATGAIGVLLAAAATASYQAARSLTWTALDLNTFWYGVARTGRTPLLSFNFADIEWTARVTWVLVACGALAIATILVRFGLRNHRSAETPPRVTAAQVAWVAIACVTLALLVGAANPALLYYLATH